MTADLDELLSIAGEAAQSAGEHLLDRWRGPVSGLETKSSPTDPVSDADRDAERLVRDLIARARPDDGIRGEEGTERPSSSGLDWYVDPLDGTVNYLYGRREWAVSVAVEDASGPLAGVVFDPSSGETYRAARGRGAERNGVPIHVSAESDLSKALVGTGFSYEARLRARQAEVAFRLLPEVRDLRRAGSAALDLAAVASGQLDAFYESPMMHWDIAAGILLVQEAGGVATRFDSPEPGAQGVLAANEGLHERLRGVVVG